MSETPTRRPGARAVLAQPQFRRYFAGQTTSSFGDALVPLALVFAVLSLPGASGADLGLVLLASRAPVAALVLFGGIAGDRWPRHRIMLAADLLRCTAQVTTGLLLVTGTAQIWHLALLQAAAGVGTAFFSPAAAGLLPATVPPDQLQAANALLSLASNTSKIAAIGISGTLVATVGPGWALLIDAATFAVSTACLATLTTTTTTTAASVRGRRTPMLTALVGGWRHVRDTAWLRAIVVYSMLLQLLVIGPQMVLGPLVAERHLGGAPAWAAIGVAQTAGAITGGIIALRTRPQRPLRAALLACLAMIPYLLALAVPAPLWALTALAVATGIQGSYYLTLSQSVLQTHVQAPLLSRVSSYTLLGAIVIPISLAATGPLADHYSNRLLLTAAAAWVLISTLSILALRSVTHLSSSPGRDT
jgi:MFS family permease